MAGSWVHPRGRSAAGGGESSRSGSARRAAGSLRVDCTMAPRAGALAAVARLSTQGWLAVAHVRAGKVTRGGGGAPRHAHGRSARRSRVAAASHGASLLPPCGGGCYAAIAPMLRPAGSLLSEEARLMGRITALCDCCCLSSSLRTWSDIHTPMSNVRGRWLTHTRGGPSDSVGSRGAVGRVRGVPPSPPSRHGLWPAAGEWADAPLPTRRPQS